MSDSNFNLEGFQQGALDNFANGTPTYADIVFAIDLTGSMQPIINKVKEVAYNLGDQLIAEMKKAGRDIRQLRVKIIGFRDFYCDGPYALEQPIRTFILPDEKAEFKNYVDGLTAKGGGDDPENSLEALALAMKSDWCQPIDPTFKKRHIIVLFTDNDAHPLEKGETCTNEIYPKDIPHTYTDLVSMWGSATQGSCMDEKTVMDPLAKRLAIYAPENLDIWNNIKEDFSGAIFTPIQLEKGGEDITTDLLIQVLTQTLS